MTPDVDAIRAALAAATELPNDYEEWVQANKSIRANAPVWLAQLCDEVERLRARCHALDINLRSTTNEWNDVMAERDAALAECERLRALLDFPEVDTRRLMAERDAALAECKRLRIALMKTAESES